MQYCFCPDFLSFKIVIELGIHLIFSYFKKQRTKLCRYWIWNSNKYVQIYNPSSSSIMQSTVNEIIFQILIYNTSCKKKCTTTLKLYHHLHWIGIDSLNNRYLQMLKYSTRKLTIWDLTIFTIMNVLWLCGSLGVIFHNCIKVTRYEVNSNKNAQMVP